MPSIGAVACDLIQGAAEELKEGVITWRTPGYRGVGAQTTGLNVSAFRFIAIKYDVAANVRAWAVSIEALQGDVLTIVDDRGVSHTNLLITKVSQPSELPVTLAAGLGVPVGSDTIGRIALEGTRTN